MTDTRLTRGRAYSDICTRVVAELDRRPDDNVIKFAIDRGGLDTTAIAEINDWVHASVNASHGVDSVTVVVDEINAPAQISVQVIRKF